MTPSTATPEATLAEIVDQRTGAARVLERHGLDYCCGGRQTLGEACEAADVDVADVIADLDATPAEAPDWTRLGLTGLADHIEETHHRYLRTELPRLQALAEKVASVHGERHPELSQVETLVGAIRDDLEPHLDKEEQVLFPMLRELAHAVRTPAFHCGSLMNPIGRMQYEHDRTGELLRDLRRVTDEFAVPADGCASYKALYEGLAELEADTHLHIHKENDLLFPAALVREGELGGRPWLG